MDDVEVIVARLRNARALPELLAASFEAFDAIRVVARGCEDLAPWLFAAFMTAADAAVDGTQAITISGSHFTAATTVRLVDALGVELVATGVTLQNANTLVAQFPLGSVSVIGPTVTKKGRASLSPAWLSLTNTRGPKKPPFHAIW